MPRDPKAIFEILVRENSDMLAVFLRAAIGRDQAAVDDLFQDTMLTAWRRLDDYDRTRPFGPWLRGIAIRLVMAHRRKQGRRGAVNTELVLARLDEQIGHLQDREGDTMREKMSALSDCVDALDERYGGPIRLRYLHGATSDQVAERLSITGEALKKRLQRGRAQLLECLKRKSVLPEPSS